MNVARTTVPYLFGITTIAVSSLVSLPSRADPPPPAAATPSAPASRAPPEPTLPPAPPPEPSLLPASSAQAPTASRRDVALGAAGVAAAAVAGAVVFGALALHEKAFYDQTPTYANTDNGNDFAAYADGCIALAVAGGITSLVLYLTSASSAGGPAAATAIRAASFSVSPLLMAHGGGAGVALPF